MKANNTVRSGLATYAEGQAAPASPESSTGWTPAVPCCNQGSKAGCVLDPEIWRATPWQEIGFMPRATHWYQWRYESDGSTLTVEARGDLDCDGIYSSYKLTGAIENGGATFNDTQISAALE